VVWTDTTPGARDHISGAHDSGWFFGGVEILQHWYVKVQIALLVALGFIFGALLGAHWVHGLSDAQLKKAFGIFLILMGMKYLLLK